MFRGGILAYIYTKHLLILIINGVMSWFSNQKMHSSCYAQFDLWTIRSCIQLDPETYISPIGKNMN